VDTQFGDLWFNPRHRGATIARLPQAVLQKPESSATKESVVRSSQYRIML
jgi:hypothetical protein